MISLLLVVCIVGFVISIILWKKSNSEYASFGSGLSAFICAFFAIICLIYALMLCYDVGIKQTMIEQKIAMYQEENQTIEERIDSLVKNYMEYEADTYEQFKNESSIELVSLFPELKADELVMQQMKLYNGNKVQIAILKSELIDLASSRWLLYFGK